MKLKLSSNIICLFSYALDKPRAPPSYFYASVLSESIGTQYPLYHMSLVLRATYPPTNSRTWCAWPPGQYVPWTFFTQHLVLRPCQAKFAWFHTNMLSFFYIFPKPVFRFSMDIPNNGHASLNHSGKMLLHMKPQFVSNGHWDCYETDYSPHLWTLAGFYNIPMLVQGRHLFFQTVDHQVLIYGP